MIWRHYINQTSYFMKIFFTQIRDKRTSISHIRSKALRFTRLLTSKILCGFTLARNLLVSQSWILILCACYWWRERTQTGKNFAFYDFITRISGYSSRILCRFDLSSLSMHVSWRIIVQFCHFTLFELVNYFNFSGKCEKQVYSVG